MEGFWAQMSSGADLLQTAPADRWDADAHYAQPGAQSGIYARLGAYCAGMQDWDAAYYKLPANEALAMTRTPGSCWTSHRLFSCCRKLTGGSVHGPWHLSLTYYRFAGGPGHGWWRHGHDRQRGRVCGMHVGT